MFQSGNEPETYISCIANGYDRASFYFQRDTRALLRVQLSLETDLQVVPRPCVKGSPPEHPSYTLFCYDVLKGFWNHVQRSTDRNALCNNSVDENDFPLVGMAQVYTNKTITSVEANIVVAYPVHVELSKYKKALCELFTKRGYKMAGFLSVRTNDEQYEHEKKLEIQIQIKPSIAPSYDKMPVSMKHLGMKMKLQVLHAAIQTILQTLRDCMRPGCVVNVFQITWNLHPSSMSYCRHIFERREFIGLKHGAAAYP